MILLAPEVVVNVYQKPLTGEQFEGRARLLKELNPDEGDGLSRWEVCFISDDAVVQRTINRLNAVGDLYPTANIYDDPLNKRGFEGVAYLLTQTCPIIGGQAFWKVRFVGTDKVVDRVVNESDIL